MIDLSALNLRGKLEQNTAQGPGQDDDASLVTTATVYEVDAAAGAVRVGVRGGVVWLPAVADRYDANSLARVLIDPTAARPVLVLGAVAPRKPAELGVVKATSGGTITVNVRGIDYAIAAPVGTFSVGQSAWVMLDNWGVPVIAIGPSTTAAAGGGGPTAPGIGGTVVATATIGPQVSGTWQSSTSRWGNWNGSRYGGPTNIYQGNQYGSGPLTGFAGYGDQVANLGAVSIDEIILTARKNDTNGLSAALVVQGSPSGGQPAGAPSGAGETASSGSIAPGASGDLAFTAAMREAFRTGAAKGLIAVGGQYGGFGGTATPGSFVLKIRYTKNA
ncbi:hypothetical protein [Microbacterium maritypicum]|uniref:hypothetical protein n=1 Tax=Microbacterium maritypicum TaxID=33918 RepID=UPI0037FD7A7F